MPSSLEKLLDFARRQMSTAEIQRLVEHLARHSNSSPRPTESRKQTLASLQRLLERRYSATTTNDFYLELLKRKRLGQPLVKQTPAIQGVEMVFPTYLSKQASHANASVRALIPILEQEQAWGPEDFQRLWRRCRPAYYATFHFRRLSYLERKRRNGCCDRCKRSVGFARLRIHHLHYNTLGSEQSRDIEALCTSCHSSEHDKKKWRTRPKTVWIGTLR